MAFSAPGTRSDRKRKSDGQNGEQAEIHSPSQHGVGRNKPGALEQALQGTAAMPPSRCQARTPAAVRTPRAGRSGHAGRVTDVCSSQPPKLAIGCNSANLNAYSHVDAAQQRGAPTSMLLGKTPRWLPPSRGFSFCVEAMRSSDEDDFVDAGHDATRNRVDFVQPMLSPVHQARPGTFGANHTKTGALWSHNHHVHTSASHA